MAESVAMGGKLLLDAFFPPRCMICGSEVGAAGTLCAGCFGAMHFITRPFCQRCGHPFPHAIGEEALCGVCLSAPPPYDRARAALRYDDHARPLVTRFKFADRTEYAGFCAGLMLRAAADALEDAEAIVPVPLHWRRLLTRRYNQAALLARALERESGVPMLPDVLRRVRHTRPQARLSRPEREANVRGAFRVPSPKRALLKGKIALLVDDVLTTGATLHACARALRRAGAKEVRVITLARRVLVE